MQYARLALIIITMGECILVANEGMLYLFIGTLCSCICSAGDNMRRPSKIKCLDMPSDSIE
jgi:hypothetical protein